MERVKAFLFAKDGSVAAIATDASGSIILHVIHSNPQDAILELEDRLSGDFEIYFIGSSHPDFAKQRFGSASNSRKCLPIPENSAPKEMLLAQKFFEEFITRNPSDIENKKYDYPDFPWGLEISEENASLHTKVLIKKSLRKIYFAQYPAPSSPERILIEEWIQEIDRKKKLLLHICCGPDAAGVVKQLKEEFDLTCFWYDPNIQPKQEHDKRLEAFEKVMKLENIPYINGEYDVDNFFASIKGLETTPEQGAKCSKCYDMRLDRAAREAKDGGFDMYATTLAISPHKVQKKLEAFGELNEKKYGIPYFHRNFMKDEGFKQSVSYTRDNDIYRQDYCGCFFSLPEGGTAAKWLGDQLGFGTLESPTGDPNKIEAPQEIYNEYARKIEDCDPKDLKG